MTVLLQCDSVSTHENNHIVLPRRYTRQTVKRNLVEERAHVDH